MTTVLIIILVVIAVVALALLGAGAYFCRVSLSRNYKKGMLYKTRNRIYDTADTQWFNGHKKETAITSSRNLNQVGYVFEQKGDNPYWMIVIHGYTSQALNMSNYVKEFYNMGYSVLAPELMGMGKSEGEFAAMAGYDADDIMLWIKWILKKRPDAKIGLFGVSMGGATVMNTLGKGLPENVEFFIEDSGYVNLNDEFKYQLKAMYNLNFPPLIKASSLICKMKYGFFFGDVKMEESLRKNKLPGLVLHGAADDFVPTEFGKTAYELLNSPKEIKFFEGSKHIRAEHEHRKEYWETIEKFLLKYSSKFQLEENHS